MMHINPVTVSVLCACGMSISCVCSLYHCALNVPGQEPFKFFLLIQLQFLVACNKRLEIMKCSHFTC